MSSDTADILDFSHSAFDVWRAVNVLIDQHGHEDAQHTAAFLANSSRQKGDRKGERIWLRVMMAVRELRRGRLRDHEHLN